MPILAIGLGFGFILFRSLALNIDYVPPTNALQIVDDWSTKPFTRLSISSEPCGTQNLEPLFTKTWDGTLTGCVVKPGQFKDDEKNKKYKNTVITEDQFYDIEGDGKQRSGSCDSIAANPRQIQEDVGVDYICGERSPYTYLEMVNRRGNDFGCEQGYSPCSYTTTSMNNTVCVKTDELSTNCPITDIQLVTSEEAD